MPRGDARNKPRCETPASQIPLATIAPRGTLRRVEKRLTAFLFDRIPEHADRSDFDLADVAGLHEHGRLARGTDSARRPHDQNVPGIERHAFGDQADRLRNAKDHIFGVSILHDLSVQARLNLQSACAGRHLFGRDEFRTKPARTVEILAYRPLGRLPLIIPDGAVIEYGVPRNMRQRVCARDVPTFLSDESDELRLVVKLIRAIRSDHWRVVTNERGCRAEKDHRIIRGLGAALGSMIDIVQAKANDLAAALGGRK